MDAVTTWRTRGMTCGLSRITWGTVIQSIRLDIPGRHPFALLAYGGTSHDSILALGALAPVPRPGALYSARYQVAGHQAGDTDLQPLVHAGRRVDCSRFPTAPSVCREREPCTTSPCYQPGAGRYVVHRPGASGAGGLYAARGVPRAAPGAAPGG